MIGPMAGGDPRLGAPPVSVKPPPSAGGGMGLMGAGPTPAPVSSHVLHLEPSGNLGAPSSMPPSAGAGQMPPLPPAVMHRMAMMGGFPGMAPQPGFYGAPQPTPGPHSLPPWMQSSFGQPPMVPQPGYGSPTPYGGLISPNTGPVTPYQPWTPPKKDGANAYGTPKGVEPTRRGPRPVKKVKRRPLQRPRKAKMPKRPKEPGDQEGTRSTIAEVIQDLTGGPGRDR